MKENTARLFSPEELEHEAQRLRVEAFEYLAASAEISRVQTVVISAVKEGLRARAYFRDGKWRVTVC